MKLPPASLACLSLLSIGVAFGAPDEPADPMARLKALLDAQPLSAVAPQAKALVAEIEAAAGGESLAAAEAFDLLGAHWKGEGIEASEMRAMAERAVTIKGKAFGAKDLKLVSSLKNLGSALDLLNRFAEAREAYARALAIQEQALAPDHPEVALTLYDVSYMNYWLGSNAESQRLCERSVEITE